MPAGKIRAGDVAYFAAIDQGVQSVKGFFDRGELVHTILERVLATLLPGDPPREERAEEHLQLINQVAGDEFARLKGWLNEKVHRPGQRWRAGELCRRVTGRPLSHKPLIAYLRAKYAPLYGL